MMDFSKVITVIEEGDDGYGKGRSKNHIFALWWNRGAPKIDYFGNHTHKDAVSVCIKTDGETRGVFNGWVSNEEELEFILSHVS